MALTEKKILESERNQIYVKSTPGSRLTGTVSENKNVFDKFPQLIMNKYNELVDLLIASGLDTIAQDITNRYTKTQVDEIIESETNTLVSDIGINLTTGVITITKKNGTVYTVDTALEKVPATFEFIQDTENDKYYIKVTNVDGSSSQTEVTNLMNQYTFASGDNILFTVLKSGTTTTISASIKSGSITMAELDSAVKNYFDSLASSVSSDKSVVETNKQIVVDASQTVTENTSIVLEAKEVAVNNSKLAKSYAVGGTDSRTGEDTDNAKYYYEQAKSSANAAKASESSVSENASSAQSAKESASSSAKIASDAASSAAESESNALASKNAAENASNYAKQCASGAEESANAAYSSATNAANSSTAAKAAQTAAEKAKAAAEAAKDKAEEIVGGNYATKKQLNSHIEDSTAHITADERTKWNAKAEAVSLIDSTSQAQANLTPAEILQARQAGKILMAIGGVCTLMSNSGTSQVVVHRQYNDSNIVAKVTINSDKSYTVELVDLEKTSNKVISLSASSTDTQYPSAKCVYDMIGNVEALLAAL